MPLPKKIVTSQGDLTVPRWFVGTLGFFFTILMTVFLPWACWVTTNVMTTGIRMDESLKNSAKIDAVDMRQQTQNQSLTERIVKLESRNDQDDRQEKHEKNDKAIK